MEPGAVPAPTDVTDVTTIAASNHKPKNDSRQKMTDSPDTVAVPPVRTRKVHYANGDRYEGGYMDGIGPHGAGRYVFASGACYDGEYVRAKKHGRGRYEWANGDIYDGYYEHDARHGYGVHSSRDGFVFHDGLWANGDPSHHP